MELFPSLKNTFNRLKKYPQLFWTIFVAVVIVISFIVIALMFIRIAQDAQERLINVRIGSIQDSLSEFFILREDSQEKNDSSIINLMIQNPTILEFTFYTKENNQFKVSASSDKSKLNTVAQDISATAQLALDDIRNSYTVEIQKPNERLFQTFRSLTQDGKVIGLISTTQKLSQEDLVVENNIRNGIIIFIFILALVILIFFRYSKIIDYVSLYEELKGVDHLKNDFISMASHEIKTPLATIRGYSEYITESGEIPEEYKEYSRRIDMSSKQLAFLVEDMLDVSRLQQGQMQFDIKKVLVPDFIKNVLPDFETLAKEKKLKLVYEYEDLRFAYIMADENRLKQILINILGNAIKYTKQGEIKIKLSNSNENIEIRISDTGIGMTEDERKNLFEKFYRVRNDETKDIRGTGLGLWITKQLIEKMDGTFSFESIKGAGTHVIVKFKGLV